MSVSSPSFELADRSQIAALQIGMGPIAWLCGAILLVAGLWQGVSMLWGAGLAVLLATPAVIGIQCAWMGLSNRSQTAARLAHVSGVAALPALGWWQTLGVGVQESLACLRVFGLWQPWGWRSQANVPPTLASAQTGVVLIHGYFCNRGLWLSHLRHMRTQGTPCIAVNLEPAFGDIDAYVPVVERAVAALEQATGKPPILMCHSMGGLAARAWLRSTDASRVAAVITLGSPHHGTAIAALAHTHNGKQMRLLSPWLQALAQDEAKRPNARDKFHCVVSDGDNIVFPVATATLQGAQTHFVPACGHVALVEHSATYALVQRVLAQANAPQQFKQTP